MTLAKVGHDSFAGLINLKVTRALWLNLKLLVRVAKGPEMACSS